MKKQHITFAVCMLACAVSAAAAVKAQAEDNAVQAAAYRGGNAVICTGINGEKDMPDEDGPFPPGGHWVEENGTTNYVMTTHTESTSAADNDGDYGGTAHEWMEYNQLLLNKEPDKTHYQIGETLDLTGALMSGDGDSHFVNEPIADHMDMVDATRFDNTKPGKYAIVVQGRTSFISFYVYVEDGANDTTASAAGTLPVTTVTTCTCDQLKGPQGTEGDYGSPIEVIVPPTKTVYQIGEELDLSGAVISGGWVDRFDHEPLINHPHLVDAREFDNTTPGVYTIYLHDFFCDGEFRVSVVGGTDQCSKPVSEITTDTTETTTTTTTGTEVHGSLWMEAPPTKTLYLIGQELDVRGAVFNGGGAEYQGGMTVRNYDWFSTPLEKHLNMVDASEFDNTKPGTYTIYVKDTYGAKTSFTVKVLPKETGDVNGDANITVSDAVLVARINAEDTTVKVSEQGIKNADVDQDGRPTSEDVTMILRIIAGLF